MQFFRRHIIQSHLHLIQNTSIFVAFSSADPLHPEASICHIHALKHFLQAVSTFGTDELPGNIVAVLGMAAGVQYGTSTQPVGFVNEISVHTGGTHHTQTALISGVFKVAGTSQICAAVRTPLTAESEDFFLGFIS